MRRTCLLLFISVLLFSTSQAPWAGPKGTNRPLKGFLSGEATFQFEWNDLNCSCLSGVTTKTVASGELSHLGATALLATHCAPGPEGGWAYLCAKITFTAANGDELRGAYDNQNGNPPFVIVFNGGTGRFKQAKGEAVMDWSVQPMLDNEGNWDFTVPWPWWTTIEGSISY